MKELHTKVMILGAGAGGFGAAYTFSEAGVPFVIADRNPGFGGTAVYGGVSCFEPGVSFEGVHRIISEKLLETGDAEVQKTVSPERLFDFTGVDSCVPEPPYRWGLSVRTDEPYDETLKRCRKYRSGYGECRRFMTDENALQIVMDSLIDKEYCTELFESGYISCEYESGRILSVTVRHRGEDIKIYADVFLDCSGSIVLARDAGCRYSLGDDDGDISGINGVSIVFRVSKREDAIPLEAEEIDESDPWIESCIRNVVSCFNTYPNGDINVNMLPTMTGAEWINFGDKAESIGRNRVFAYWDYMRKRYNLGQYRIIKIFRPGIREDYRLCGRKILTVQDITEPYDENAEYAAAADHALDIHGVKNAVTGELEHPYGIPVDCTRPVEYDNLFAACRGASFSHAAASSARLTRTMMSLGEGTARYIIKNFFHNAIKNNSGRNL